MRDLSLFIAGCAFAFGLVLVAGNGLLVAAVGGIASGVFILWVMLARLNGAEW